MERQLEIARAAYVHDLCELAAALGTFREIAAELELAKTALALSRVERRLKECA